MTLEDIYRLCPNRFHDASPYDQWQQLADAVIEKAVEDYTRALAGRGYKTKSAAAARAECEAFFLSDWFSTLSPLDGEVIIQKLSANCKRKRRYKCRDKR